MQMKWTGVMPATTTAFDANLDVDHASVGKHAQWLIDHGCTAIVTPGSLGKAQRSRSMRSSRSGRLW